MIKYALLMCSISFLASCSGDSSTNSTKDSIFLGSSMSVCTGEAQQLCLRVRDGEDENFENFFGPIVGFDYSWGHSYELTVERVEVEDPPADGSSIKTSLVAVVSDKEDEIGAEYTLSFVDLLETTIRVEENTYLFLGQPFTCASQVDCEGLLALSDSGGQVNLTFKYMGEGEIQLTNWN